MKKIELTLRDGSRAIGDVFDEHDFDKLKKIFFKWQDINKDLKSLGGRNLNVPDVFSEAIYCYFFNSARTNGEAHSYDAVSLSNSAGIQIKSASIVNDCTSFGPTSTWDKLIFVDFVPNGAVDGNIWFYEIPSDEVYNLVLNEKEHETFRDQQKQGRRPRFSVRKAIIEKLKLQPIKKVNILE